MSKLARYTQKIFGSSASANQMAQFGSFAAGTPATYSGSTITPALVQNLSNYLTGWFGAVIGNNSPTVEDQNAVTYLSSYQLAYLMQEGVPEWDTSTTYFIGSLVNDGNGNLFVSLTDSNSGNALTSAANWQKTGGPPTSTAINPATQSPYALLAGQSGVVFDVNSANGAMQINLPASPPSGFLFTVKDVGGAFSTANCTIHRAGSEHIEGLASDFVMKADYGVWTLQYDGTNYWLI